MRKRVSIKNIIILLILGLSLGAVKSYYTVDGITACIGPVTVVAINPKLEGEYREMVIRHENAHKRQIDEMGCWTVFKMRLTREGREQLEDEAVMAELEIDGC
jgi:hypothetical protein